MENAFPKRFTTGAGVWGKKGRGPEEREPVFGHVPLRCLLGFHMELSRRLRKTKKRARMEI